MVRSGVEILWLLAPQLPNLHCISTSDSLHLVVFNHKWDFDFLFIVTSLHVCTGGAYGNRFLEGVNSLGIECMMTSSAHDADSL